MQPFDVVDGGLSVRVMSGCYDEDRAVQNTVAPSMVD